LNAKTCKEAICKHYECADGSSILGKHFCAVTANVAAAKEFGVPAERVFEIWDWVIGRYSVSSAVGVLPLSLVFGFDNVKSFLKGMNHMDKHFYS
jgi:glucose-6-phosphate isomerase